LIIKVLLTGDVHRKSEYYDHQPLVLVKKLVQEDFVLVQKNDEGNWCYIGGVACFSFTDMGLRGERGFMKIGNPLAKIHSPVPNFKSHIHDTVIHIFDRYKFAVVPMNCYFCKHLFVPRTWIFGESLWLFSIW
jgi:hypothetical protein